jgi:hypothetical protein
VLFDDVFELIRRVQIERLVVKHVVLIQYDQSISLCGPRRQAEVFLHQVSRDQAAIVVDDLDGAAGIVGIFRAVSSMSFLTRGGSLRFSGPASSDFSR